MSIAYGGIIAFLFRGVNVVVALVTLVLTSNQLGADGRGTFVLGITAVGIVSALTGGLTASAGYQVSNQRREPGVVLLSGGALAASLGALAIVSGFAVTAFLNGQVSHEALAVAFACAAVILNSVSAGIFLGHGALVRYNIALVAPPLLSLSLIAVGFFVLDDVTPGSALWAFAVGQWLTFPLLLILGAGTMLRDLRFDGGLTAALARFALVAAISSGVSYLNYRADTFVVEHFEGKSGVAVYSGAVYIAESVWQFSGSLALATYARIGSLDRQGAAELTTRVMRHTLVILSAVCIVLFAGATVIVDTFFNKEFAGMATALRILLPGTLLYGLAAAFSGFYTYQRGIPWAAAVVAGVGLAVDLSLDFVFVPKMGVNGAALASAIAYGVAMLGAIAFFLRDTGTSPAAVFRFGRADIDDYRILFTRLRAAVTKGAPAAQ